MAGDITWITKGGVHIPITESGGVKKKSTNDYMNEKIRNIKSYDENEEKFKRENSNILYENNVITEEQQLAIEDYTSDYGYGSSDMINRVLNGEKNVSNNVREFISKNTRHIDSCIKGTIKQDIYVYKKVRNSIEELKVNKEISNKGFTSTSIYESSASKVYSGNGIIIKIKVSRGTKALYIGDKTSFATNEHELLFGRNHKIKITKINGTEVLGELI